MTCVGLDLPLPGESSSVLFSYVNQKELIFLLLLSPLLFSYIILSSIFYPLQWRALIHTQPFSSSSGDGGDDHKDGFGGGLRSQSLYQSHRVCREGEAHRIR